MRSVRVCLLLGGTALLLAGLRGQAAQGARPLPGSTMRNLVGGACRTKCQNACQAQEKCDKCTEFQGEGELCPGGGGGTGTAFRCVSDSAGPRDDECVTKGADSKCTPAKICTCDNAEKPVCTERNNTAEVTGKASCDTKKCASK